MADASTLPQTASSTVATARRQSGGFSQRLQRRVLPIFTTLAIVYLMIPIAVMIVYSFNKPDGKFNYIWNQFSLDGWAHPFDYPGLGAAVGTSLFVAVVSTVIATIIGTMMGLALTRYRFRGRGALNGIIFLPMATPEIVMGASLLTLFVATALPPLAGSVPTLYPTGLLTILIAHVMFNISYVVVTVKARLAGFDRRLEEAAMDLGANELATFTRVTLPLIAPGILAALLLAFALSVDDF
ncbi:MAG: ABC transporter permease, partial [Chloroflexota bacterium]